MVITKTSKEVKHFDALREIANRGCNKCPCCGETRTLIECIKQGEIKGISSGIEKTWTEGGLFKPTRYMKCDCWSCNTCGAEWESDSYEYM